MRTALAASVATAIRDALDMAETDPRFRDRVVEVLSEYPNVLHPRAEGRATVMTMGAFHAAGGTGDAGVVVAAAMEVLTTAAHVFDRLADGDGQATDADLQLGHGLVFLSASILEAVRARQSADAPTLDWAPIYRLLLMSSAGQQHDIDLQDDADPSLEDAKLMTERKCGAFAEAMTRAAAAAGAGSEMVVQLSALGRCLGTRSQLIDDATDASPNAPDTSDIRLGKKTVPIVYFLSLRGDRPEWDALRDRFLGGSLDARDELNGAAIEDSGAIEFALTLANWYRMKADTALDALETSGCKTHLLRRFIGEPTTAPMIAVDS